MSAESALSTSIWHTNNDENDENDENDDNDDNHKESIAMDHRPKTQLRLAREARGLSRAWLAAAAGLRPDYYRHVEQLHHALTPDLALVFSRLLGAPIAPAAKIRPSSADRAPRGSAPKRAPDTRAGA